MPHLFAGSVWSTRKIFIFTLRSLMLEAAQLLSSLHMTPTSRVISCFQPPASSGLPAESGRMRLIDSAWPVDVT